MKIGYLGPKGTFTEEAMEMWIERQKHDTINKYTKIECCSIQKLIYSIGERELDEAVVPFENSLEGSVNLTIDLLIHEVDVKVKGELILPIRQNLLTKEKVLLKDVEEIYSHPQALYQSRKFIYGNLPHAKVKETLSTAEAARIVAERGGNISAIGSRRLAGIYGLKVLAEDIQEHKNNMTRFYILSSKDGARTGRDKTAVVFSTENRPGSLFNSLRVFAKRNLNLTKIESRPSKRILGEYVFFVEVEGHREDGVLNEALEELKQYTGFIKLLGSYPIFDENSTSNIRSTGENSACLQEKEEILQAFACKPVRKDYPPSGGEKSAV
ncbi:MAG TPA: prephenate dehydratase [Thermoanaerobacterales bacterium]|nr:prephenate dehydratase [Thermoanaerobacterales bacterium]